MMKRNRALQTRFSTLSCQWYRTPILFFEVSNQIQCCLIPVERCFWEKIYLCKHGRFLVRIFSLKMEARDSSAEKSKKALVSPWKETYAKDVLRITYCLFQLTLWYSLSVLETKAQVIIQMMQEKDISVFTGTLRFFCFKQGTKGLNC